MVWVTRPECIARSGGTGVENDPGARSTSSESIPEQIAKLGDLRDRGILSEDEFEKKKTSTARSNVMTVARVNGISICYETLGDPDDECLLLITGFGQQLIDWNIGAVRALC